MLRNTDIPCAANVAQQTAWRTADTGWLACSEQHADALAVQANRRISSSIDVISLFACSKGDPHHHSAESIERAGVQNALLAEIRDHLMCSRRDPSLPPFSVLGALTLRWAVDRQARVRVAPSMLATP